MPGADAQAPEHRFDAAAELAFVEPGTLAYRWKADERDFAMPVRIGARGAWQVIEPTTAWNRSLFAALGPKATGVYANFLEDGYHFSFSNCSFVNASVAANVQVHNSATYNALTQGAPSLRARLARGAVTDLAMALARGVPIGELRNVLSRTLRDPTLRLAFPREGLGADPAIRK